MANYAFIDAQNVHLAIRDQGWKMDWRRFRVYLRDKFKIEKAFLFIGYYPGNESLYTELQSAGYICVFKPTLELKGGIIKGNCDAELVLHCMIEYGNYEKALVISGDGDFHCLIEYLEEKQKLARLIIPNKRAYSALLRRFHKDIVFLSDPNLLSKFAHKKSRH